MFSVNSSFHQKRQTAVVLNKWLKFAYYCIVPFFFSFRDTTIGQKKVCFFYFDKSRPLYLEWYFLWQSKELIFTFQISPNWISMTSCKLLQFYLHTNFLPPCEEELLRRGVVQSGVDSSAHQPPLGERKVGGVLWGQICCLRAVPRTLWGSGLMQSCRTSEPLLPLSSFSLHP